MNRKWTIDDSRDLYNLERWGLGFFDIDDQGNLVAWLDHDNQTSASVIDAVHVANQQGLNAPLVVRFPDIIRMRIEQINSAFELAIQQFKYNGRYRCFFPAKVNQHRDVLAIAIEAGRRFAGGVEAGSKAELVALLLMTDNEVPVLCNGFKDQSIVELALRGSQLGRDVTIVLEKPGELRLVIDAARRLNVTPKLGVRVKLAARSGGRWNTSGGSKSKFGLTVSQVLKVVEQLRREDCLDCLELLHFHPGSQISNVRKIKASIIEAAWIYADLVKNKVPLKTVDVGGGLAIDYTGDRNQDPSSKNYSLQEYANDVVYYIQQVCQESKVSEPDIVSESGRSIAAHHSMIVVPVLSNRRQEFENNSQSPESGEEIEAQESNVIKELQLILESLQSRNLSESFHDAQATIETAWQMFSIGALTLKQRSQAEQLFDAICRQVGSLVAELEFVPRELEELRHQLAETYIANFSLFQAVPDAWAISQVFPVVPIHRLNQRPSSQAQLGDITCDSDGKIDCFIGSKGGRNSLPVHSLNDEPYYLGIFLIGAYQEALSDDHNLMGKFHVLSVAKDKKVAIRQGATTSDVLKHVHHDVGQLCEALEIDIESALQQELITDNDCEQIRNCFGSVLKSYTYLNADSSSNATPAKPHIGQQLAARQEESSTDSAAS